jgi:glycosyltransferase involved in cell wall biosynthesis
MTFASGFKGKVIQVIEALDYGDAVSNHVLALHRIFLDMGLASRIHSKWHHPSVAEWRADLDDLRVGEEDLVLLHYACYSEHSFPFVRKLRCTKICVYHNITPHSFFAPGTMLHELCLKGREEQLPEVVRESHYFWGDSKFNVEELLALGAKAEQCAVVPIVVNPPAAAMRREHPSREQGVWLFIGRIAPNKGQRELVRLFAAMRAANGSLAQKLNLVGNYSPDDQYYRQLREDIALLGLENDVILTGKTDDATVHEFLSAGSVYVSMSLHEGFGVPLIEAACHGLPVIALHSSAVGETLGWGGGLAHSAEEVAQHIERCMTDEKFRLRLVEEQALNAQRFTSAAVTRALESALTAVLPRQSQFRSVSIVICTYNRSDLLDRCLDYLQYQTSQDFEVIVVNGPSTDNTEEVVAKYRDRIKYATNPARNLSISRNIGIELSDGDLVAFIDDDAIPFDDWIATLLREFNRRPLTHAAIGGPAYFAGTLKFQAQDIAINRLAIAQVNVDSALIGTDGWERSMLGTNTCFRADIVREQGGFDEQFDYFLDESELSFRLQNNGYIVGYSPVLYLRHEFAQSDNRVGQFNFNWFSICKNTAYYIAAYSGMQGEELRAYAEMRAASERVEPLRVALAGGEISQVEFEGHVKAIERGTSQGLRDALDFPKTRKLGGPPGRFEPFASAPLYPIVGRDLRALHICIVTKEFPPFVNGGGIGTLYYHLASELLLMGHRVSVVVPGSESSRYEQGRLSVRYEPIRELCPETIAAPGFARNTNWSVAALHAVAEIHQVDAIDVVDSALWDSEALSFSLLDTENRPPLVVRLVTPFAVAKRLNGWSMPERESSFFNAAEKRLIERADAIVPISESIAHTVQTEHRVQQDDRWQVAHCGIAYWASFLHSKNYAELKFINGQPVAFPEDAKLIVFVGRLEPRKGVDLLMSAAAQILAADLRAHLILAGKESAEWPLPRSADMSPDIAGRIHIVGEVDDSTRDKLLNAAYCVVFPSRYESFGLVPLEAFVHGAPVVATNAGAIPEVVIAGECGLLFEPENSGSLADCVIRLLTDTGLRNLLSAGAKQRVRRLSSRNSAIGAIKLYSKLCGARQATRLVDRPAAH